MKKKHVTIAALIIAAATTIALVAWSTIALLDRVDDNKNDTTTSKKTPESQTEKADKSDDTPSFGEPDINEDQNKNAEAIEREAANLMESDPAEAQKRYLAAAEAYREAGNVSKVSEMQANATTAEALLDDLAKQQAQSNNQN